MGDADNRRTDIAVIGMSCRFPGGCDTPEAYWELLASGRNAVSEIPADRWDHSLFKHPSKKSTGRSYTFAAGTLGNIRGFDAGFFGISPREADAMDPHQRMLLELAWEALESGGQTPERIEGRNCAVYVGISSTEYGSIQQGDVDSTNAYMMLGTTLSIAANRISYQFDLRGPSMSIDTACSSSLVALNEALNAIWAGRCDMALVGGMSLLVSPFPYIGFSKATMLSEYGLCRAFGANPGGYVRGEGGGVVAIKPLDAALRDGDPIHAVIVGSGANADGRTKGIALPSHETQRGLIEQTLEKFDIDPALIDFFEAHGTGTAVGDPAESRTIGEAIAQKRKPGSPPLPVGSAKSNIGHLEPASGMAGLIKAIMAIRHRAVPATLHAQELNPEIDFAGLNIEPVQQLKPINVSGRPIYAGLNSFGFGGANATVILREHVAGKDSVDAPTQPPLVFSAKTPAALQQTAKRLGDFLREKDSRDYYDIAYTAAHRRARHAHRAIVHGSSVAEISDFLTEFAAGNASPVTSGEAVTKHANVGFVFNGNGAQWPGMGRALYAESDSFRREIDRIDALIAKNAGWSLVDVLHAEDADERLQRTEIAQPALLAIQIGLVTCLDELGLRPKAVAGHSVGEVAAAYVAGAIDIEQAVRLILARSDAQGKTRGHGRMAAAGLTPEQALEIEKESQGQIELAAINSSSSVTLAGDEAALQALGTRMEGRKTFFRMLDLDYAFHSHVLDPVHDYFLGLIGSVETAETKIPYYSTVHGGKLDGSALDASYWWHNVRQPVRFSDAIAAMIGDGIDVLVEIGPHAILQPYLRQILREGGKGGAPISSMTKADNGAQSLRRVVDTAFCTGVDIDLDQAFPIAGNCVTLPTYPWQHEDHWFPVSPEAESKMYRHVEGPFLGTRPQRAHATWEGQIDADLFPFLADHNVGGSIVFPAAGYIECALEASVALFGDGLHEVEMLEIRRPIVLSRGQSVNFRFVYDEDDKAFRIETRKRMSDDRWSLNAVGRLAPAVFDANDAPRAPALPTDGETVDGDVHYHIASNLGLSYGPSFRLVENVTVSGNAAVAALRVPDHAGQSSTSFVLHPAVLDSCLQTLFSILYSGGTRETSAYLPYQAGRVKVFIPYGEPTLCHTKLRARTEKSLLADFTLFDAEGRCVAEATGFRFLRAELQQGSGLGARRFRFEMLPLDYVTTECVTPLSSDIAGALDFTERNAVAAAKGDTLDLDAVAHALTSDRPAAKNGNGANGSNHNGTGDGGALWRSAFAGHPAYLAELNALMQHGTGSGDAALNLHIRDHLLESSPSFAPARMLLKEAICKISALWPADRRLRILEIGTANSLVRDIASIGAKGVIDYTIVAEDEARLANLEMEVEAGGVTFIHADFAGLLSESDQKRLGVFDIVVCPLPSVNGGMSATLRANIKDALAPGGIFLLSEPQPAFWIDVALGGVATHDTRSGGVPATDTLLQTLTEDGFRDIETVAAGSATVFIANAPLPRALRHDEERQTIKAAGTGWLVVYDPAKADGDSARALAAVLERAGAVVIQAHACAHQDAVSEDALQLDPDVEAQWLETYEAIAATGIDLRGVVLFGDMSADARPGWSALLAARAMSNTQFDPMPRLHIVTRNAASFRPTGTMNLAQAPLWGIGRVVANEVPKTRLRMIDIQGDEMADDAHLVRLLGASLLERDPETELVLSPEGSFVPRLRVMETEPFEDGAASARKLSFTSGRLGSLTWRKAAVPTPKAGEIVIAPLAAGLNFRDVMYALGVLPEEALEAGFAGASLGMEAAGIVTAVGEGVTAFRTGDEVICFAANCFDSHVVTPEGAAAKKPARISFEEAATIPTAFFTVQYALDHLARLRKGERVLIHGAAGGVGLAAIQVAQHLGAEIFVTVGTPEKRRLMAMLGVAESHILDSRSLRFADDIMRVTNGQGVDVVLNSLAGEAIYRNLGLLRPFGRFLELGKRDFYENNRIGLKFFRNNLSYFGIDADQLMVERPELAQEIFSDLIKKFEDGIYTPLPYRAFDAERASDAFRLMQKSGHIGKIVIRPPVAGLEAPRREAERFPVRADASVLVTGGLSGFGLATARWLAAKGAGGLVLIGRSGVHSDEARAAMDELEACGVHVIAKACDVTDLAAVTSLFDEAKAAGFPIRGVIHAAAVFEDATVESLDQHQYQRVIEPKVRGALTLHEATLERELDFFVLYSSITTAFGNPGQANYVAANAFLEALAQNRRAAGLPGQAIGWGAIGDAGYLARNEAIRDQLATKLGSDPLSASDAMVFLEDLISRNQTNIYAGDINWQRLRAGLPVLQARMFGDVAAKSTRESDDSSADDTLARLSEMPVEEAIGFVAGLLAEEVGQVLRLTPEKIDRAKAIFDLGMDSLMALELKLSIEDRFGIDIPVMALSDGGSISSLAAQVVRQIRGGEAEENALPESVQAIISRHVNDDDIENLNRGDDADGSSSSKTQFGS